MTRGKLLFMFAGLCVVAILLWIASLLQQKPEPMTGNSAASTQGSAPNLSSGDFYVAGHVRRSGMYSLRPGDTLKDAIADAGGADSAPSDLIVRVMRKDGATSTTQSFPLTDVLSGANDEKLQLSDVIDVVQQAKPATVQVPPLGGGTVVPMGASQ